MRPRNIRFLLKYLLIILLDKKIFKQRNILNYIFSLQIIKNQHSMKPKNIQYNVWQVLLIK